MNNTLQRLFFPVLLALVLFACKKDELSPGDLNASTRLITLDYTDDQQTFTLTNVGNATINWSSSTTSDIIALSPQEGAIAPGDSTIVIIRPDRQNLEEGTYDFTLTIANEIRDIRILVELRHFIENKTLLEGQVVDADYDRHTDQLWIVTDRALISYRLSDQSMRSTIIDIAANTMSLAPNGEKLIVGGNDRVEVYATETMQRLNTIPIPQEAFDIELTNEDWAYFINGDISFSDSPLYTINLNNESVGYDPSRHSVRISSGSRMKLHPSSKYLYIADQLLISPANIRKFAINDDQQTTPLYESPYHGDFPMRGRIWFSEEGDRVFSQGASIFNATEDPDTDLTYIHSFPDNNSVMAFDHSLIADRIYLVRATGGNSRIGIPRNELEIYDPSTIQKLGSITFPNSLATNLEDELTVRPSEGHYIFFNSAGDQFVTVLRSRTESEEEIGSWAIFSGEVN